MPKGELQRDASAERVALNLRTDQGFRDIESRGEHRYTNRIDYSAEYNWETAEEAENKKTIY